MATRQKPRGRPYNRPIVAAQRFATWLHSSVYRATGGKVGGRLLGSPVLLLTTMSPSEINFMVVTGSRNHKMPTDAMTSIPKPDHIA